MSDVEPTFLSLFSSVPKTSHKKKGFSKKSLLIMQNPFQKLMGTLECDDKMKVRSREGVMRQRPPKKLLALFMSIVCLPWLANGSRCGYDEMYIQCSNKSNCGCVKCLMCPPGQGLYPQCGSTLNKNVTMNCLPCKDGTYSEENDFESCHPCHICDGHETIQKCNSTHNAVCKKECMAGYELDEFLNMCRKNRKNPTNPQKTTTTKPTAELPSINLITRIDDSKNTSGPSEGVNKTTQSVPTSVKPSNDPNKHGWSSETKIAFYFLAASSILFGLIVLSCWKREKIVRFLCHLYCSCTGHSQTDQQDPGEIAPMNQDADEEGIEPNEIRVDRTHGGRGDTEEMNSGPSDQQGGSPGGNTQAPRTDHHHPQPGQGLEKAVISDHSGQQELAVTVEKAIAMFDNPVHNGLLLIELSTELKVGISVQLCNEHQSGWKEIGRSYDIPQRKLKEFHTRCKISSGDVLPGEFLFEFLETARPRLTVKEFLHVLKVYERNDIICYICEEYFK